MQCFSIFFCFITKRKESHQEENQEKDLHKRRTKRRISKRATKHATEHKSGRYISVYCKVYFISFNFIFYSLKMVIFMIIIFFVFSGKGKNVNVDVDVDVDDNTRVGVEANVNVDANTIPASSKQKVKRGRPRKATMNIDIEKVIKELLSDIERSNSEPEDLFYDADEVRKEKDGKAHWWESIDLGVNEMGADLGDKEAADNSSDGLGSLQGSDSDDVGRKKRYKIAKEVYTHALRLASIEYS
jgi:hypothetical protein